MTTLFTRLAAHTQGIQAPLAPIRPSFNQPFNIGNKLPIYSGLPYSQPQGENHSEEPSPEIAQVSPIASQQNRMPPLLPKHANENNPNTENSLSSISVNYSTVPPNIPSIHEPSTFFKKTSSPVPITKQNTATTNLTKQPSSLITLTDAAVAKVAEHNPINLLNTHSTQRPSSFSTSESYDEPIAQPTSTISKVIVPKFPQTKQAISAVNLAKQKSSFIAPIDKAIVDADTTNTQSKAINKNIIRPQVPLPIEPQTRKLSLDQSNIKQKDHTVRITIGQIKIRTKAPKLQPTPKRGRQSQANAINSMSLIGYLQKYSGD